MVARKNGQGRRRMDENLQEEKQFYWNCVIVTKIQQTKGN
jgi:hypothetical protein